MPRSPSLRTSRASSTAPVRPSRVTDFDVSVHSGYISPAFAGKAAQRQKVEANVLTKGFLPKELVALEVAWFYDNLGIEVSTSHHSPSIPFPGHKTNPFRPGRNPTLQTRPTRPSPTTLSRCMPPRRLHIPGIRTSSSSSSRKSRRTVPCSFTPAVLEYQPLVAQAPTVKRGAIIILRCERV